MSERLLSSIMDELAEKRNKAAIDLDIRRLLILNEIPGFKEAEEKFKLAGIDFAKNAAFGRTKEVEACKHDMENMKKDMEDMLISHGYSLSDLDMHYSCKVCKDTGYLPAAASKTGGNLKGKSSPAILCNCIMQRYYDEMSGRADSMFRDGDDFSSFDETLYADTVNPQKYGISISPREQMKNNTERCYQFVRNFCDPNEKDLLFCGPTGTGKTFMANCIGREIAAKGYTVFRQSSPRMFELINKSRFEGGGAYEDALNSNLLILDDLGVEAQSASKFSTLYDILESRNSQCKNRLLKTIIATNLSMKELYKFYDERIVSRLFNWYDVLRFAGDDVRFTLSVRRRGY